MKHWICVGLITGALAAFPVHAQTNAELTGLWEAKRYAELERAAMKRLSVRNDDAEAYRALARAATGQRDAARRDAALKTFEACTERHPTLALCSYGVGSVLGVQLMANGVSLKAMMSVGRVRDNLQKAIDLDATLFAARLALVQFYMAVPTVAGGSSGKASELVQAINGSQPEGARVLRAFVLLMQKKEADAELELSAFRPVADAEVNDAALQIWRGIAFGHVNNGQSIRARPMFERMVREQPQLAIGEFGLARVRFEAGELDAAIAAYEKSAGLLGADELPIDYRLGLALLQKGERERGKAALERFVLAARGNANQLSDAKKRLAALG